MKLCVLLFLVYSTSILAYSPSLESLFRNANNMDVGNNTVMASLIITELDPNTNTPLEKEDNIPNKYAIKYVIFNEREDRPTITQVKYKDSTFNYDVLADVEEKSFKRLSSLVRNNEAVDAKSYYSVMAMLLNNDGSFLIDFLKSYNSKVKANSEIINTRKVKLLGEYKYYLQASKKDETSNLENPLRPENDEKRARAQEIMKEPFLKADDLVRRVKKNDKFVWSVQEENVKAHFDENHYIKDLTIKTPMGQLQYVFGRFVQFREFEFPEFVWFTDLTGRKFEIRASSIKVFKDNSQYFQNRFKKYVDAKEKNNFTNALVLPSFIL